MALQPGDVVVTIKVAKEPNDGGDAPTKEEIDAVPSFPPKSKRKSEPPYFKSLDIVIEKGDVEGHEFHGNQWTGGNTAAQIMSAAQINKELDRLDAASSKANDALIAAGFGDVRPSDVRSNPNHPMASHPAHQAAEKIDARQYALRAEIAARYGPGAPSRLPSGRGFGPRKP